MASDKPHPLDNEEQNQRAEAVMLAALLKPKNVSLGDVSDRRLLRYMVIRSWVFAAYPHPILAKGREWLKNRGNRVVSPNPTVNAKAERAAQEIETE